MFLSGIMMVGFHMCHGDEDGAQDGEHIGLDKTHQRVQRQHEHGEEQ